MIFIFHSSFIIRHKYMDKEELDKVLGKILLVVFIVCLLIISMIYFTNRWSEIRDIRRQADTKSILKALELYNNQYGKYPESQADDGDGWEKSNDFENMDFFKPLVEADLLAISPFDPKNDSQYYYRYQRFPSGSFGCQKAFAVFQVMEHETTGYDIGRGWCEDIDFVQLAPNGFTWMEFE